MQFIKDRPNFIKLSGSLFFTLFLVLLCGLRPAFAQYSSQDFANHNPVQRRVTTTEHFKIVYDLSISDLIRKIKPAAERLFNTYKELLGTHADEKIVLYINGNKLILSKERALNTNSSTPIWHLNPFFECFNGNLPRWKYFLRYEIAYVFQQRIQSSRLGLLQAFLLSRPSAPLWSAGLPLYLSVPRLTTCDMQWSSDFWNVAKRAQNIQSDPELKLPVLGRSQIHFYNKIFPAELLKELYNVRKQFLGIPYFDFDYAFLKTFGVPYTFFYSQWKRQQFQVYNDSLQQSVKSPDTAKNKSDVYKGKEYSSKPLESEPYHSFFNIRLSLPVILPYYLNTSDYGLFGAVQWQSPLRLHKFLFAGILSIPDVGDQSIFYTSYVNNRFGPRIKLTFKHYTSKSDWLDLSVSSSNVAAASSLWKIDGSENPNSNWYAGFMLRYLNVEYLNTGNAPSAAKGVVFDNKYTTQTDLRLVLAWRALKPTTYNLVHPLKGHGFRLSVTGSGSFLNSKTQYARFYGEAFALIPAAGKQRIYLYAAGAFDMDEPIGADYLYFSDDGDYELPEPKILGSSGRAVEGYIRGYENSITGEYFTWGSVEYRIPLLLKPGSLLGVLPLPKLALALFTDGGVIGGARTLQKKNFTAYRLSLGTELKSAIRFGGFPISFKMGIAQALNQPFGPFFYFTIQPAIPF